MAKSPKPKTLPLLAGQLLPAGLMAGVIAALSGVSCTGDVGEPGEKVPGPPQVTPELVPAAPTVLQSTSTCTPLRSGERLLSVSPEGHAWLLVDGTPSSLRIVDPFGNTLLETSEDLELTDVSSLRAWSGGDAALFAQGGVWRLDDLARIELSLPDGFALPATYCGNPADNGVLLSAGKVFERRQDGQWWVWDPGVSGVGAPTGFASVEGECLSTDNLMWLTADDGTLYRVEPSQFARPIRFPALVHAAVADQKLAVLEADRLWFGTDLGSVKSADAASPAYWSAWTFPGVVPTALSAAGSRLYMTSGAQLLMWDGSAWFEVQHEAGPTLQAAHAYSGGVWALSADTLCHESLAPTVRVEGLRPNQRGIEFEYTLRLQGSELGALSASLDGAPLTLTPDATDPAWSLTNLRLDQFGWHELQFAIDDVPVRSMRVKRVPAVERSWALDIQPIYQQNCATAGCHVAGATEPVDMSTYDHWVERAQEVRTRVVVARNMPPAANVGPDWGDDDIEVISQWIEGGMLP